MNVTIRNFSAYQDNPPYHEAFIILAATNTPQRLSAASTMVKFQHLWIYPGTAANAGRAGGLVANAGTIYAGKSAAVQPDPLANTDVTPLEYDYPLGQCGDLTAMYITGTQADGAFIQWI